MTILKSDNYKTDNSTKLQSIWVVRFGVTINGLNFWHELCLHSAATEFWVKNEKIWGGNNLYTWAIFWQEGVDVQDSCSQGGGLPEGLISLVETRYCFSTNSSDLSSLHIPSTEEFMKNYLSNLFRLFYLQFFSFCSSKENLEDSHSLKTILIRCLFVLSENHRHFFDDIFYYKMLNVMTRLRHSETI